MVFQMVPEHMVVEQERHDLVSIVIPCFNYELYIEEAIQSALDQDYPQLEVIVVDDGSKDGSADIAKSFGEKIRYIYQDNQGLSAARNTGIAAARGEYMVFLDADDRLGPSMARVSLEKLIDLGGEYAVVANQGGFIDENGDELPLRNLPLEADCNVTTLDLMIRNRLPAVLLVRKSIFETVGEFDTLLKASEDRDMWIRISCESRIVFLAACLSFRRRHGSNMSSNAEQQTNSIKQVLAKAYDADRLQGLDKIYWPKIWSFYYYQAALLYGFDVPKSIGLLMKSMFLWPVFLDARILGERRLFRLRSAARIIVRKLRGAGHG